MLFRSDNLGERTRVPGREDGWYADYAGTNIVDEIGRALKVTSTCTDFRQLRAAFDPLYNGGGMPYAMSYANEVLTKAVCIFKMTGGNLKETIIAAVNLGRDTDCIAAVASGLAGALDGSSSLPQEWIDQVNHATSVQRFTNNKRNLREHADGLYTAYKKRLARMRTFADAMDID